MDAAKCRQPIAYCPDASLWQEIPRCFGLPVLRVFVGAIHPFLLKEASLLNIIIFFDSSFWVTHLYASWLTHTRPQSPSGIANPLACDMTRSYVWHDSFICVTRLVHMCDMTHSYVWHDSFISVTCLTPLCLDPLVRDITHLYASWLTHMCLIHSAGHL